MSEVSSSGSVNNVIVANKSEHFLFVMDGDMLMGAKQNRILNTSVLICPHSKIEIPVSCVEQGRWSSDSFNFSGSDYTVSPRFRANKVSSVNKNFKSNKKYYSEQRYIWNMVSDELYFQKVQSSTNDYGSVYSNEKYRNDNILETVIPDEVAEVQTDIF